MRVLRENGFVTVRADGTRRLYAIETAALHEVETWLDRFRHFWDHSLDALATELARGKRERRLSGADSAAPTSKPPVNEKEDT